MSRLVQEKLTRLRDIVQMRQRWQEQASQIHRMSIWVIQTEHVLDGSWATDADLLTNQAVGERFDAWMTELSSLTDLSPQEQTCLAHFLKVSLSLRPHFIQCYELEGLPRTNNTMEQYIRHLKTRYRRISGRKNWNAYLLRYGSSIAYYDYLELAKVHEGEIAARLSRVKHDQWRDARQIRRQTQSNHLTVYRFRHQREQFLGALEARWSHALDAT